MSSQSDNLVKRIIDAQEELRKLKATQIIGGEGMGYYEYPLEGGEYNIANRGTWAFFIFFVAVSDFPLMSVEYELYENNNRVRNPLGAAPAPYGGASSSICRYSFLERETIGPSIWVGQVDYQVDGRVISTGDPACGIWMTEFQNYSGNTVKVSFRNIKIRSTLPGVACCRFADPYGAQ